MLIATTIDACELRYVANVDVKGAHLHAKIDKFSLVKIKGSQVDVVCHIHKDYERHATVENGERVLCMMLNSGSCGTLQGALLWYKMLTSKLIENGFTVNSCGSCVANKIIDGSQCTMFFILLLLSKMYELLYHYICC